MYWYLFTYNIWFPTSLLNKHVFGKTSTFHTYLVFYVSLWCMLILFARTPIIFTAVSYLYSLSLTYIITSLSFSHISLFHSLLYIVLFLSLSYAALFLSLTQWVYSGVSNHSPTTKLIFYNIFLILKCTIILITYLSTASPLEKTVLLLNIGTQS